MGNHIFGFMVCIMFHAHSNMARTYYCSNIVTLPSVSLCVNLYCILLCKKKKKKLLPTFIFSKVVCVICGVLCDIICLIDVILRFSGFVCRINSRYSGNLLRTNIIITINC